MSDLAREVQKNYAKHLIEEAKKRANKTISDAYELLEKETKQQAETIERLRDKLINAHMAGQSITGSTPKLAIAQCWLNKLEAGEL